MLKVKYIELNPSSGHYGYRSHNFDVIPEKIKSFPLSPEYTINRMTEENLFMAIKRHCQQLMI